MQSVLVLLTLFHLFIGFFRFKQQLTVWLWHSQCIKLTKHDKHAPHVTHAWHLMTSISKLTLNHKAEIRKSIFIVLLNLVIPCLIEAERNQATWMLFAGSKITNVSNISARRSFKVFQTTVIILSGNKSVSGCPWSSSQWFCNVTGWYSTDFSDSQGP